MYRVQKKRLTIFLTDTCISYVWTIMICLYKIQTCYMHTVYRLKYMYLEILFEKNFSFYYWSMQIRGPGALMSCLTTEVWQLKTLHECSTMPSDTCVHRMSLKWLWKLQGQRYPYLCCWYPSPNFQSSSLYGQQLKITEHFQPRALNDSKMTLNTKRSGVSHIYLTIVPRS